MSHVRSRLQSVQDEVSHDWQHTANNISVLGLAPGSLLNRFLNIYTVSYFYRKTLKLT